MNWKYTPYKGFFLIVVGAAFDLLWFQSGGLTVLVFAFAWSWSVSGAGYDEENLPPGAVAHWHSKAQAERINTHYNQSNQKDE